MVICCSNPNKLIWYASDKCLPSEETVLLWISWDAGDYSLSLSLLKCKYNLHCIWNTFVIYKASHVFVEDGICNSVLYFCTWNFQMTKGLVPHLNCTLKLEGSGIVDFNFFYSRNLVYDTWPLLLLPETTLRSTPLELITSRGLPLSPPWEKWNKYEKEKLWGTRKWFAIVIKKQDRIRKL